LQRASEKAESTYYAYERSCGSFPRTFTLPDQVDSAHVKAELKAGELTIAVPKTPAAVAKKIRSPASRSRSRDRARISEDVTMNVAQLMSRTSRPADPRRA